MFNFFWYVVLVVLSGIGAFFFTIGECTHSVETYSTHKIKKFLETAPEKLDALEAKATALQAEASSLAGKYEQAETTLGDFVSLVEYADAQDKKITYISDENQQAQYIKMLKEEGRSAIIMPHLIDTHFISFLEYKEQWKFTRIDTLPQETKDDESIVEIFKNTLNIEDLKITASSLKISLPAIIVEDEQERRMNDMTKMFGNAFTKQKYTLVLNTDSEIINKIETMEDANKKELICKQIYDIARVCHNPLTTEEMTEFIERSSEILKLLM